MFFNFLAILVIVSGVLTALLLSSLKHPSLVYPKRKGVCYLGKVWVAFCILLCLHIGDYWSMFNLVQYLDIRWTSV